MFLLSICWSDARPNDQCGGSGGGGGGAYELAIWGRNFHLGRHARRHRSRSASLSPSFLPSFIVVMPPPPPPLALEGRFMSRRRERESPERERGGENERRDRFPR